MKHKISIALGILILLSLACGSGIGDGPPRNAAVVEVWANTSLEPWLEAAVGKFNKAEHKTASGKPVYILLKAVDVGQAVTDMAQGKAPPAIWIPDNPVWANLPPQQGGPNFAANCVSVAESPLVIAMWRPIAESLGWPGRSLGWLDIGSLAADPSAWAYYSGGQFGPQLRVGHTHPGLSATGANTLLAVVQAAQGQSEAVSAADIQEPIVQASMGSFEGSVSWFSPSTSRLGQAMQQRGPDYLGAAIMYESDVLNNRGGEPDLVPVYPFEGTFMATHPACLNPSVSAEVQQGAELFRAYLLDTPAQQTAISTGLRPVNDEAVIGPLLDPFFGVDLSQPETVFAQPSLETIFAAQEVWKQARKPINLVMLMDISGSMDGRKMEGMRSAAIQFVEQMGDDDYLTIIPFWDEPVVLLNNQAVGPARTSIIEAISQMEAGGGTALYDAIYAGAEVIENSPNSSAANAMVVLTDGQDTSSYTRFNRNLITAATANDTTVFTIAYGRDADESLLAELANQANGNFYQGTEANIAAIYNEMSAAFGGAVGIGR